MDVLHAQSYPRAARKRGRIKGKISSNLNHFYTCFKYNERMTEKNTTPLPPIQGPKMRLINKHYWDVVYRLGADNADDVGVDEAYGLADNKPNATVRDLINAMGNKGNDDFIKGFPGHHQNAKKDQAYHLDYSYARHEIAHICPRIAHSPQQEFLQLAFEGGMAAGPRIKDAGPVHLLQLSVSRDRAIKRYTKNMKEYTDHKPEPITKRNWAIYTAAGMYLREKIDRYINEQGNGGAQQKRDYCADYRLKTKDADLTELTDYQKKKYEDPLYFEQILNAPARLILLSKAEWRAIEAVALGMREPEETDYPKRMEAIKQALEKTDLLFDKPKFAEKLRAEQEEKARNGATGRGQE